MHKAPIVLFIAILAACGEVADGTHKQAQPASESTPLIEQTSPADPGLAGQRAQLDSEFDARPAGSSAALAFRDRTVRVIRETGALQQGASIADADCREGMCRLQLGFADLEQERTAMTLIQSGLNEARRHEITEGASAGAAERFVSTPDWVYIRATPDSRRGFLYRWY